MKVLSCPGYYSLHPFIIRVSGFGQTQILLTLTDSIYKIKLFQIKRVTYFSS
uniref:Uncharacterized protein n=1 Tax=Arundo donax TaxID=35708 RepID=A0A0A9HA00_ARUDO